MTARPVPRCVADLARLAVLQPLSRRVPADDAAYAARKGPSKLAWRTWQRRLHLRASGQAGWLRTTIDPAWRSCLWIQAEAPQVGDALMDLSARSLLCEHGIQIDLLAAPHLVDLFRGDRWFRECVADGRSIDPAGYDFALVGSHSRRALAPKMRFARRLPWLSLAGYYSVPDYHRSRFVTQRLADALGFEGDDRAMALHSRQKLAPLEADRPADPRYGGVGPQVALALGGVRPDRTYGHWPAVAAALHASGVRRVLLVGSANGLAARRELIAAAPIGIDWHDAVDRTDLPGTRALLAGCELVICADGGLMHLALTTRAPVLALFSAAIDPAWRLPLDFDGTALRSKEGGVDAIDPADVARAALRLLARARPQGRAGAP